MLLGLKGQVGTKGLLSYGMTLRLHVQEMKGRALSLKYVRTHSEPQISKKGNKKLTATWGISIMKPQGEDSMHSSWRHIYLEQIYNPTRSETGPPGYQTSSQIWEIKDVRANENQLQINYSTFLTWLVIVSAYKSCSVHLHWLGQNTQHEQ